MTSPLRAEIAQASDRLLPIPLVVLLIHLGILYPEETLQLIDPLIDPRQTAPDRTLDAPIIAPTVDEVVHFVLAPGERVRTFCFAQRLVHDADFRFVAAVLAEHQLLMIRPTDDSRYALESAEPIDRCTLVTSKRRPDGSLLIVIETPSGLLRLFVDNSWTSQATIIIDAFTEPTLVPTIEHPVAPRQDGVSFEGDGSELAQQFAGLVDEPEEDLDGW